MCPGGIGVLGSDGHASDGEPRRWGMIAFRVIYFLIPLAIGLPAFLASEIYFRGREPAESENTPNRREATLAS